MNKSKIIILIVLNLSFTFCQNNTTEYIIYTNDTLYDTASILKNFYNNFNSSHHLQTEIIKNEDVSELDFSNHLFQNYDNTLLNGEHEFNTLKYLLILGDENIIIPQYYENIPVDDLYSTDLINSNSFPNPKLRT